MGGYVSLAFADAFPYMLKGLVLLHSQAIEDSEKVKESALMEEINKLIPEGTEVTAEAEEQAMYDYFVNKAQNAVKNAYEDEENGFKNNTKFLWIKNIWMTDASYKHPIHQYTDFETEAKREKFSVGDDKISYSEISKTGTVVYSEEAYNLITAKLNVQKEQANGYYILIALSIGTILLQQVVTMRSQKEQQKYSTVDGQGASQQKTMLIMMTGMFAIFSFMYSSAFSIYMITSNILSLFSTVIINKIVDVTEAKREQKKIQEQYNKRFPGRIAPKNEKSKDKNK